MITNKVGKMWGQIIKVFFMAFIVLFILSCTHLFVEKSNLIQNWGANWIISCAGAVLLIGILKCLIDKYYFDITVAVNRPVIWLVLIPLAIKVVLIFVLPITEDLGDISAYARIAYEFADSGVVYSHHLYAAQYPHLFWFGMFLVSAPLIGNHMYYCYEIYIAIVQCATNIMLFFAMRKLGQKDIIAVIFAYLPSQLVLALCVTHENGFLFYSCLALLIFSYGVYKQTTTWKKVVSIVVIALLMSFAARVNSMGLVLIITVVICGLSIISKDNVKWIVLMLALTLCFNKVVSISAAEIQYKLSFEEYYSTGKAFYNNIYIGANYESEGRFDKESTDELAEYVLSQMPEDYSLDEYYDVVKGLAIEKWAELFKQPVKLFQHLLNKFSNVWSGTHYSIEFASTRTDNQSGLVHYGGLLLMVINNLIWIILLANTLIRLWDRKEAHWDIKMIFAMTFVLGMMAVLLIAEVMNKYSLSAMLALVYIIGGDLVDAEAEEA